MVGSSLKILFRGGEFNEMDMLNKNMVNNVLSIKKWNWYKLKHMLSFYHNWILYYECVFQKWLRRFKKKKEWGGDRKGIPRCADSECPSDDCVCQGGPGIFPITYHVKFLNFHFSDHRPPIDPRMISETAQRDLFNTILYLRFFLYYLSFNILIYIKLHWTPIFCNNKAKCRKYRYMYYIILNNVKRVLSNLFLANSILHTTDLQLLY